MDMLVRKVIGEDDIDAEVLELSVPVVDNQVLNVVSEVARELATEKED